MRIHTKLSALQMRDVIRAAGAPINFRDGLLTPLRSRSHLYAYEVRLEGSGGRNNTGLYGAGDYDGATWDEWGAFFGALYELDQLARCGGTAKQPCYGDAEHFHFLTNGRFKHRLYWEIAHEPGAVASGHLPADTHPRHRWHHDGMHVTGAWRVSSCAKQGCSALTRSITYPRFLDLNTSEVSA